MKKLLFKFLVVAFVLALLLFNSCHKEDIKDSDLQKEIPAFHSGTSKELLLRSSSLQKAVTDYNRNSNEMGRAAGLSPEDLIERIDLDVTYLYTSAMLGASKCSGKSLWQLWSGSAVQDITDRYPIGNANLPKQKRQDPFFH